MTDDFYADWEETDLSGPRPATVEEKIEYGIGWYSGDSGVSEEELGAYLRDLVVTARSPRARSEARLRAALEVGALAPREWEFALIVDRAMEAGGIPGPTELNEAMGLARRNDLGGRYSKIRAAMFEADGLVKAGTRWTRP